MAESEERPWRVGGVADLDLSIYNINIYSESQTLTSTYETLPPCLSLFSSTAAYWPGRSRYYLTGL
jgi:hypothetical protein